MIDLRERGSRVAPIAKGARPRVGLGGLMVLIAVATVACFVLSELDPYYGTICALPLVGACLAEVTPRWRPWGALTGGFVAGITQSVAVGTYLALLTSLGALKLSDQNRVVVAFTILANMAVSAVAGGFVGLAVSLSLAVARSGQGRESDMTSGPEASEYDEPED